MSWAWAFGVITGFYLRGFHCDCHLKGYLMSPRTVGTALRRWGPPTPVKFGVAFTAVMLAMTFMSAVSWFRASNAIDDAAAATRQTNALVVCQSRATEDSLTLWRDWRKQFKQGQGQSEEVRRARFFASLDDYIASLELLQRARQSDDPAAVCEGRKP